MAVSLVFAGFRNGMDISQKPRAYLLRNHVSSRRSIQAIARREFYFPAKRFECHFAKYEKGSFYKLHSDRHLNKPGRLLSCVLYLTDNIEGGELSLYDKNLEERVIRPEAGKTLVFDSSHEHQVAKSLDERWSLTGWIRSDIDPSFRL